MIYSIGLGSSRIRRPTDPFPISSLSAVGCVVNLGTVWGRSQGGKRPIAADRSNGTHSAVPSSLSTTHTHSKSFALSSTSPGLILSPYGALSVSRCGSSPLPSPPSQHFNLSPLCRHPKGINTGANPPFQSFYPLHPPSSAIYHATGRAAPHPGHLTW